MIWTPYKVESNADYIPMEDWGKDHWSTLAYIETREVDYKGLLDNKHMRCNPRLHRTFADKQMLASEILTKEYPTHLKNKEEVHKHDDWSCIEDMMAEGLVELYWTTKYPTESFGSDVAKIKLTENGLVVAAKLRAYKAKGGNFAAFECLNPSNCEHTNVEFTAFNSTHNLFYCKACGKDIHKPIK